MKAIRNVKTRKKASKQASKKNKEGQEETRRRLRNYVTVASKDAQTHGDMPS